MALARLLHGWASGDSPLWLQAAADGRWEEARGVHLPTDEATARALVRDAGPGDADVAVEVECLEHPLVFVGAARTADGGDFEERVARIAKGRPADPASTLTELAGAPPDRAAHVELGAANAWRSVGPLRLWERGGVSAHGRVASLLRARPELACCQAPVALAVAFDAPGPCWIGIEVSSPSDGGHVVDAPAVEALLARLFA